MMRWAGHVAKRPNNIHAKLMFASDPFSKKKKARNAMTELIGPERMGSGERWAQTHILPSGPRRSTVAPLPIGFISIVLVSRQGGCTQLSLNIEMELLIRLTRVSRSGKKIEAIMMEN